jgi:hypothetical protein
MQMNQPQMNQRTNQPSRSPYYTGNVSQKANRPIPGMKLAYGAQAQERVSQTRPAASPQAPAKPAGPGLLARLRDSLLNLVTEEATTSNERPIGISRLSNTTFQASQGSRTDANGQPTSFFRSSQPIQDYRFNQLTNPFGQSHPRR